MEFAPKGIVNLGNTCYLNSCIQIFCQFECLNQIVLKVPIHNPTKVEKIFWENWKSIVSIMQTASGTKTEFLHPSGLVGAIQQIAKHKRKPIFEQGSPEDISEFILFFIDTLHECLTRAIPVQISGHSENATDDLAIEVYKTLKTEYEKAFSEILYLFHGVSVSRISSLTSPPKIHSQRVELFHMLDLPILAKPCTLYECLDDYVKPEILDGDNKWYNEESGKYEDIEKSLVFWSFPTILVICLKRILFDGQRNHSMVNYPTTLDLQKYATGYKRTGFVYDLQGICAHIGGMNDGHYTSFVKKDNHWFYCNDERIQIVEKEEHLLTKYASCLFYMKKNNAL